MFTDFYKKIIIPARGYYNSSSSNCPGYFWNTNQSEQVTVLNGARDIYGNYLMNYTSPTGYTGLQLSTLSNTQGIDGTNIGKLYTNLNTSYYYDRDNDQWAVSSSGMTNYFSFSLSSNYMPFRASGIGTPDGNYPYLAPLYSDALMVAEYPTGNEYGYAASDFIMIGTGNTANTSSTYQLETPVSVTDCNFSVSRTINGYNITIVNKKNTDLTISELGYCVCATYTSTYYYSDSYTSNNNVLKASDIPTYWNGIHHINTFTVQGLDDAGFNRNFINSYPISYGFFNPMLCCRTVLPNPITIPAGERITITWNFELDM